jgi:hypothetical protein
LAGGWKGDRGVVFAYQSLQSSRGGPAAAGDGISEDGISEDGISEDGISEDGAAAGGCPGAAGGAPNSASNPKAGAGAGAAAASCEPASVKPGPPRSTGADPGPELPAAGPSSMTRCPHLVQKRAAERSSVPHLPHQRLGSSTAPPRGPARRLGRVRFGPPTAGRSPVRTPSRGLAMRLGHK